MEGFPSVKPSSEQGAHSFENVARSITMQSAQLDRDSHARLERAVNNPNPTWREKAVLQGFKDKFPITTREGEVQGHEYVLYGVNHAPETFLIRREELERAIAGAGVVVLEGAPELSNLYGRPYEEEVRERFHAAGKSSTEADTWIQANMHDPNFEPFFHEMEQLAKKYQKPVITVDPHSGIGRNDHVKLTEENTLVDELTKRSSDMEHVLVGAWMGAVVATGGVLATHEMKKQKNSGEEQASAPAGMSRRQFLATAAGATVAGALTPTALAINAGHDGMLDAMTYQIIDYRNVSVARGIDAYAKEAPIEGPIVFIYGAAHVNGLQRYLENPALRDAKYELYQPLRAVSAPRLEEYEFTSDGSSPYAWKHIQSKEV